MTTDFRAMCAELVDDLEMSDWPSKLKETFRADIARARALLDQPVEEGPSGEEVDAWADQQEFIRGHGDHPCGFWIDDGDAGALVRAALARWGNSQRILDSSPLPHGSRRPSALTTNT